MEKDGVYRPDRTIRDIYEDGLEAHQYDELGLSPYARIGSLASDTHISETPFRRWPKPKVNYHAFTYVGPLVGETLSPADRMALKPSNSSQSSTILAAKRLPSLIVAAIAYINKTKQLGEEALIATEKAVESDKYLSLSNAIPVFVSFVAVLLLVYAAVVSPQNSISSPNGGGGQSFGGSSFNSPNIIDNRALFPLSIFPNGNAAKNNGGAKSDTPATQYQYVSPSNAQSTVPLTNTRSSSALGGGSATGVQAPASTTIQQPTSTPLTQPVYDSSSSSTSSLPVQTGGSTTNVGGSTSTGSLTPSSGSGSGSSISVPGVTSPTNVSTPSTSVTSPVTNKPVISTSPTTITLN